MRVQNARVDYETQITQPVLPDWSWDPHEDEFQKYLTALKELVKTTGKAYVPKDYVAKDLNGETLRLWHWCSARRIEYHRGTLHPERVKQLSALPGWEWTVGENAERDAWTAFDQFVLREGHALVPLSHVEQLNDGDVRLGKWVWAKRRSFAGGFLTPEVIRRFEAAPNWSWNPTEARAERYFLALRQFQKREGHIEVPRSHIEDVDGLQMKLGFWVRSMRQKGVKGLLHRKPIRLGTIRGLDLGRGSSPVRCWTQSSSAICYN